MSRKERCPMPAHETTDLWKQCKAGASFTAIGRALGRHVGSVYAVVRAHGGVAPATRPRTRGVDDG